MKRLVALLIVVSVIALYLSPAFAWDHDYTDPIKIQTMEDSDKPSGEDHPWGENDQIAVGDAGQDPFAEKTWYETGYFILKGFLLGWDHPVIVNEIKQMNQAPDDVNQVSDPEQTRENENNNSTKPGNS